MNHDPSTYFDTTPTDDFNPVTRQVILSDELVNNLQRSVNQETWSDLSIDENTRQRMELAEWYKNPPPDVARQLALDDPAAMEKYAQTETRRVCEDFRSQNPNYLASEENYETLLRGMTKRLLGKGDWVEDPELELVKAGQMTLANLTEEFRLQLRAGSLSVPKGTTRNLTEQEKTKIVAQVRMGQTTEAVINYVAWSLPGGLPEMSDPLEFLSEYPQLASQAAWFVWTAQQPGRIDPNLLQDFGRRHLAGQRLLTVKFLDDAWFSFTQQRKRPSLLFQAAAAQEQAREPEKPNWDMASDEDIERDYMAAMKYKARLKATGGL